LLKGTDAFDLWYIVKRISCASLKIRFNVQSGLDWIDMVQDRDRWSALVNTVLNLRVS
jgi:hypothetical protein